MWYVFPKCKLPSPKDLPTSNNGESVQTWPSKPAPIIGDEWLTHTYSFHAQSMCQRTKAWGMWYKWENSLKVSAVGNPPWVEKALFS